MLIKPNSITYYSTTLPITALPIYYLRQLGFTGPYAGGKHQFMVKENMGVHIPNPHQGDIGRNLLGKILKQAGIGRDEWENV